MVLMLILHKTTKQQDKFESKHRKVHSACAVQESGGFAPALFFSVVCFQTCLAVCKFFLVSTSKPCLSSEPCCRYSQWFRIDIDETSPTIIYSIIIWILLNHSSSIPSPSHHQEMKLFDRIIIFEYL